jgi:hypothetical protein
LFSALVATGQSVMMEQDRYRTKFWAAFDAFVPGTSVWRRDLDQIHLRHCPALHTLRAEQRVEIRRRELLGFAAVGLVAAGASTGPVGPVHRSPAFGADLRAPFDVRSFGATADGKTIDTPAVNRAISAAGVAAPQ